MLEPFITTSGSTTARSTASSLARRAGQTSAPSCTTSSTGSGSRCREQRNRWGLAMKLTLELFLTDDTDPRDVTDVLNETLVRMVREGWLVSDTTGLDPRFGPGDWGWIWREGPVVDLDAAFARFCEVTGSDPDGYQALAITGDDVNIATIWCMNCACAFRPMDDDGTYWPDRQELASGCPEGDCYCHKLRYEYETEED